MIDVPSLSLSSLDSAALAESSSRVRERVVAARAFRQERLQRQRLSSDSAEDRNSLSAEARRLVRQALVREGLSGRAYMRIIGLARTIADLDGASLVGADHLAEALSLRLDHRRVAFS